jgi:sortase A
MESAHSKDAEAEGAQKPRRARTGRLAHLAGNLLLGLSLGLLSYYGITNALAASSQSDLEESLQALGPIADPRPAVTEVPVEVDLWETWAEEDLAFWNALSRGEVFGRLVIEEMELDTIVVKGTERSELMLGPGWITQTDPPGPTGNCGISGHRTTWGAPFRNLDGLGEADRIVFYSPYRRYEYEVSEQLIVRPYETDVVASTEEPMLTLTACHPPYSAAYRLVVQSQLVDVGVLEGDADMEGSP